MSKKAVETTIAYNNAEARTRTRVRPVAVTLHGRGATSTYKAHKKGQELILDPASAKKLGGLIALLDKFGDPYEIWIGPREQFEDVEGLTAADAMINIQSELVFISMSIVLH